MFEYIEINGKKMPIKFGFNALRYFSRETGITINQMENLGDAMTFDIALVLIIAGLREGARAAKEDFSYTIDELGDDLDIDMTIIERCMTLFTEQLSGNQDKKVKGKKAKPKK
tara:strand:- start:5745 stop:6083 length:339 start_codon:yes stop_codon:yes gene_type:complete